MNQRFIHYLKYSYNSKLHILSSKVQLLLMESEDALLDNQAQINRLLIWDSNKGFSLFKKQLKSGGYAKFALKNIPHTLLILFCLFLTTSCIFKPKAPHRLVNIPQTLPHSLAFKINASINLPDMYWWKQFNSPELNQFIHKALHHNNDIHLAMANIDFARSQLEEVEYNWLPGMSVIAGTSQMPILGYPGTFFIAAPLYVINVFQQFKQQKSAELKLDVQCYAKDAARLTVIAQITSSFFILISQQEAAQLYKKLIEHYQIYLKTIKANYVLGLTTPDDIALTISQIQQTQAQLRIIQHNIIISKNTLHFLLNENPGNLPINTTFKSIDSNKIIPGQLPLTVLNNRPDVNQARTALNAMGEDVGATAATLLPSITLGSYLGYGTDVGNINLSEAYFTLPIANFPVWAQINARKALYKKACINYIKIVRQALREIDTDYSAYLAFSNQLKMNTSAYQKEKQHCHWSKVRYKHGIDSNIDVIKCEINLDQFQLMLNQNKLKKMLVIVKLYQDLAGGYHGA